MRTPIRIGLDGRMRRVDVAERRRLARDLITKNPGASLTEIKAAIARLEGQA